jgi:hypothetical protein
MTYGNTHPAASLDFDSRRHLPPSRKSSMPTVLLRRWSLSAVVAIQAGCVERDAVRPSHADHWFVLVVPFKPTNGRQKAWLEALTPLFQNIHITFDSDTIGARFVHNAAKNSHCKTSQFAYNLCFSIDN